MASGAAGAGEPNAAPEGGAAAAVDGQPQQKGLGLFGCCMGPAETVDEPAVVQPVPAAGLAMSEGISEAGSAESAASAPPVRGESTVRTTEEPLLKEDREKVVENAEAIQEAKGSFSGAEHLHRHIRGEYWGITKEGFQEFMQTVREWHEQGKLVNESKRGLSYAAERFDSPKIGPNMYQVNEQVIMPVTAEAERFPGVSWALMQNPCGLLVNIFISHAWVEGVYEFEKNLLANWPKEGRRAPGAAKTFAAYICFLANPQNLDIGGLITSIEESPFSRAISNMPKPGGQFIMLANSAEPIHTRLWCVYEGYKALEEDFAITLAGESRHISHNPEDALRLTVTSEEAARKSEKQKEKNKLWSTIFTYTNICTALFGLGLSVPSLLVWRCVADDYEPIELGENETLTCWSPQDEKDYLAPILITPIVVLMTITITILVLLECHSREFRWATNILEGIQGQAHGLVDVSNAKASDPGDEMRIRAEILGSEHQINAAIGYLIINGDVKPADIPKLDDLADAAPVIEVKRKSMITWVLIPFPLVTFCSILAR